MVSYRELAMRVVGKPLPTRYTPLPMHRRVTALAIYDSDDNRVYPAMPDPTPAPAAPVVSDDGDSAPVVQEPVVVTPAGVPGFRFTDLLADDAADTTEVQLTHTGKKAKLTLGGVEQ